MLRTAALVSSQWLKKQFSEAARSLIVFDTSGGALKSGHEDYMSSHIPGARFYDMNNCIKPLPHLARNLPRPSCFTEYAQDLGVNQDSHLVLYDRTNMVNASRVWWTFRAMGHNYVSVLDGGLNQWIAEGNDLSEGANEHRDIEPGNFQIDTNDQLICTFEDLQKALRRDHLPQILDGRSAEHFWGEGTEPSDSTISALHGMNQLIPSTMLKGHIRGSINFAPGQLRDDETGCFMDKVVIQNMLEAAGVNFKKPLVTLCYNGNVASFLALATAICGKEDSAVYYGSWTEWGQRAEPDQVVNRETISSESSRPAGA